MQWRRLLDVLASIGMLVAAVMLIVAYYPRVFPPAGLADVPLPKDPIALAGLPIKGSVSAPVGVIELSDFECPFCRKFARDTLPSLDAAYIRPGKIAFAFMHLPLDIHPLATSAAARAECANRAGAFWPFHDLVFAEAAPLTAGRLDLMAQQVMGDKSGLVPCLESDGPRVVRDQRTQADTLSISLTPTFLIGKIEDGEAHPRFEDSYWRKAAVELHSGARQTVEITD